jgi:hypothetical protein
MKIVLAIGFAAGIAFSAPSAYLLGDFLGTMETSRVERLKATLDEVRGQRDAAHRDLGAANVMAQIQREAAEANRIAAETAEDRIHDYEKELATRENVAACALTPADLGRLRNYSIPGAGATGLAPK